MNSVIQFSFADWLTEQEQVEEAVRARTNPEEFGQADKVIHAIEPGDLVELGKNTQHRGEKVPKYGQVVSVTGKKVIVKPLAGGNDVILSADELFDVDHADLPYGHVQQLKSLGAKNLWQKRTALQRKQDERQLARKAREREMMAAQQPRSMDFSRSELNAVKKFLMSKDDEPQAAPEVDPLASLFGQDAGPAKPTTKVGQAPLLAYKRRRSGAEDMLGNLSFKSA